MPDIYLIGFLAVVAFIVIAAVVAIEAVPAQERAAGGVLLRHPRAVLTGWLLVSAVPTLAGLMAPDGPIPPQLMMALVMGLSVWVAMSASGKAISRTAPLYLLIGFQGFRLPLELVLHGWVAQGVAPPQMTWTGANVDILAGVIALVAIPLVKWRPATGWIPTLLGMVLLANVVSVVARSLPGPLQSFPDPITLPNQFPHVWIATVCVAGALVGHLIALRALWSLREPIAA